MQMRRQSFLNSTVSFFTRKLKRFVFVWVIWQFSPENRFYKMIVQLHTTFLSFLIQVYLYNGLWCRNINGTFLQRLRYSLASTSIIRGRSEFDPHQGTITKFFNFIVTAIVTRRVDSSAMQPVVKSKPQLEELSLLAYCEKNK